MKKIEGKGGNPIPFTVGLDETGKQFWYFVEQGKSGTILASPANTDEDIPCDAECTDFDVALTVDRVGVFSFLARVEKTQKP